MGVVGLAFVYFNNNRRFWALGEKIINQITTGPSQFINLKGSPVLTREMEERTGGFLGWLFDSFRKKKLENHAGIVIKTTSYLDKSFECPGYEP